MIEKRLNYTDREKADNLIFSSLQNRLKEFKNIASYYSFNGEADTVKINNWILENNKKLYLPKIVNGEIKFIEVNSLNETAIGTFNVMEPASNNYADTNDIECMIIPMLAFNDDLYRLGYGKGYYDRVLKNYHGYRLGIAYILQRNNGIIVEEHDERLDEVVAG